MSACSATQYVPVQELGYSLGTKTGGRFLSYYQVQAGDTLFAIAWRFGWDYKRLAKVNSIQAPYTIYVGQQLYFNGTHEKLNENNRHIVTDVKKPNVAVKKVLATKTHNSNNKQKVSTGAVKWRWPIKGTVVQKFVNKLKVSHGIEVSSRLGESVKAASSGIIVYAGNGIQGYGNLVVVKHNDTFLSAYAYNSRILVTEGAQVSTGEAIAEVGKGPQMDPRLYFEIRKDGKPVNPLWYLPKL